MAVLGKIRDRGLLLLIVVGGALLAFILTEFINSRTSGSREVGAIGSVYGEDIKPNEFSEALTLIKNTQQYQNYQEGQQIAIAWDKLTQDIIVDVTTDNLGLNVCNKEIYEFETGNININNVSPHFSNVFINQETNQFDRNLVDDWLDNFDNLNVEQRSFFLNVENEAIKTRYAQKYQNLVEKGMYTTNNEATNIVNDRTQNSNVSYVSIPFSSIEDFEISDEEIQEYYKNNIEDFQNEKETRNVEYVTFTVVPSNDDDLNVRQELTSLSLQFKDSEDDELFASRYTSQLVEIFPYLKKEDVTDPKFSELIEMDLGSVIGPYKLTNGRYRLSKLSEIVDRADSVEARHILLTSENYTVDSAKTILRDIKKQVMSGSDFGQLAVQYSEDKGSSIKGGDLGWFQEGQMVAEFNDVCFSSKVGDLKIVSTQFGVHLIQMTGVSKQITKYKIVHLDKDVLPSSETKDFYYAQANEFITALNNKSVDTSFSSFAEDKNQLVREDVNVDNMKFTVSALENSRDIVKWMFDANIGDVSNTIYTCGNNYVVVSLTGINTLGVKDLELVREQIIQNIQLDKKFESIQSKITEGSNLENIAETFTTDIKNVEGVNFENTNVNGIGNAANFVGTVKSIDLNMVSSVIRGNNSAYILSVNNKTESSETQASSNQRLEIQNSNSSGVFFNTAMKVLKDRANIVDERIRYY